MGGKTLYFGDIGNSSKTMINYFEYNGARRCGEGENPAEWMLEVTGAAAGSESTQDWPAVWNNSEERKAVKAELARMKEVLPQKSAPIHDQDALRPFAAPFANQLWVVLVRVFQQYWRTPSYLYSKVALSLFSVSLIPRNDCATCLIISIGNVHRLLLLENAQLTPRTTRPALRRLHAAHNLFQLLPADHAPLRDSTCSLRSPRTAIQDVFLANFPSIEHSR